jgi:TolB-like protein/Tfp pilus assembly protein PilF
MHVVAPEVLLFEDFRLDRPGGLYRCNGTGTLEQVAIGSRSLDILCVLIDRAGEVVSKDEIIAAVWPGTVVEDSNLTVQISTLRRVLDRGRPNGSCIRTVPGRGYRFVAEVTRAATEVRPAVSRVLSTESTRHHMTASRLSIVVLPFANLSDDREQQYFADGVTEDVTTDLSRIANSFVISRNTAFTYRNKPVDTKQIGRELGVRYLLEGSVRRSGDQLRVTAQLIDTETDRHLWGERFDRDTSDVFALQDEITTRIAVALKLELAGAEAARPTEHPDALDYILQARGAWNRPNSRERYAEVISLYQRALALDPDSVEAQSGIAGALAGRVLANMTDTVEADVLRAECLAKRAMAASPNSPLAHYAKATLLRAQRRYAAAIPEYETVLALDRNRVFAFFALGQCKLYTGSIEETIPLIERAIRLSPRDPERGVWYQNIGLVHLLQSRTVEAIIWLEKACNQWPAQSLIRAQLASAYGLNGETEWATAELAEARRLSGDDRFSSLARLRALGVYGTVVPKIQALLEATYFAGLRKAGMPEE